MNLSRSTRLAVVPAVLAALTLSACQEEAPTAAPPTPASPSAGATQGGDGGDAPGATQTQPPTAEPTQAPPSPETSGDNGGGASGSSAGGACQSTDLFKIKRGSVTPKARTEAQTVKKDYGDGTAEVTVGTPEVDTSGGDTFFPGAGMQTVVFPLTITAKTGSYVVSELHFGLTDKSDQPCKRDVLNRVVPNADEIPVKTLQEGEKLSGKIGFAVPAGAKLEDYTVVYAEDYSGGQADVAWKVK